MSGIGKTVSKNVVVLLARQVVTWTSTILLLMFLPSRLGPVNYGKFYLGQAIVTMFSLLIDFGGHFSIPKACSRNRENIGHIIVDSLGIRALLWLISFTAVNVYGYFAGYDSTTRMIIFIFSIGMTWSGIRGVLLCCFQGFEIMKFPSYGTIAESVFISLAGILALVSGVGPVGFTVITVVGTLLNLLVCMKYSYMLTTSFPKIRWKASLDLLKDGFPYFLNTIFTVIYFRIDTIMLSLMAPKAVLGWYGASYRFFDSLMFVPSIFTISIFPALSRIWGEKKVPIGRTVQKSLDFMLILGIPIGIGVFAFSREIIRLFYGLNGYFPSVVLLKIFSIGMILVYVDNMLGTALLASDKQKQLSVTAFCAIVVNVGLNYILIPYAQSNFGNGGIGSAITTIATEFFILMSMTTMLHKTVLHDCKISVQLKSIAAGIIMAGFLWLAHMAHVNWIVQMVVCAPLYIGTLLLLKTFEASDIALLTGLIPERFKSGMKYSREISQSSEHHAPRRDSTDEL
jgi:O-antigen/teichoic acid export membrane protein